MYNPGLFFHRQEPKMPAKKAASKQRKKSSPRRKAVARKTSARKKVARKKAPVRKKATKKKVSKKKAASKKKAVRKKKVAKKATRKKPAARKKAASKKKPAARKKAASKKKPAASKKAAGGRRPASKKKAPSKRRTPNARKKPLRAAKRRRDVLSGPIHGVAPYRPKRGEEYMSDAQIEHFRNILSAWKRELIFEVDRTVHHMQDEAANFPDPNDRATQESEFGLELRTRDRERKLLRKIDSPVATLSLEAQERRELAERQFRDRDDRYR
jgi:DnaK suppressor protein